MALLLVNANHIVRSSAIVDELWPDSPPASAATTLHTYIRKLRKLLPSASGGPVGHGRDSILHTVSTGYRLDVPDDVLDVTSFDRWVTDGRAALARGDDRAGVVLLRRALGLWRGAPLVDVPHGPALTATALQLKENRLTVLSQCIDAELRLGRHEELIGELTGLAAQHPLRENVHSKLMVALARAGRRAGALQVYNQFRRTLVDQLGIEPSSQLVGIQRAILTSDPVLELPEHNGIPTLLEAGAAAKAR